MADQEEVLALADIGVALLMFSIGLQFSLREIRDAGPRILAGTPVQVALTMALGTGTGLLLGWELLEALFIGGAVAVCSTVVLVKVAGEAALQTTAHGRTALGVSIVQDLLTVVMVVVLSSFGSREDEGIGTLLLRGGIALGFVAFVLVAGSRLLPRVLGRSRGCGRASFSSSAWRCRHRHGVRGRPARGQHRARRLRRRDGAGGVGPQRERAR